MQKKNYSKRNVDTTLVNQDKNGSKKHGQNILLITNIVYSILLLLLIEYLSRGDLDKALTYFQEFKIQSVVNFILIFMIVSLNLFLKRKNFWRLFVGVVLSSLSYGNNMLIEFRNMPLFPYDLMSFGEGLNIADKFLGQDKKNQLIGLIALAAFLLIITYIIEGKVIKKKYKSRCRNTINKNNTGINSFRRIMANMYTRMNNFCIMRRISTRNLAIVFVILSIYMIAVPQLVKSKVIEVKAWNMVESFSENGFAYSFIRESVLSFRRKPDTYTKDQMYSIRNELNKKQQIDNRKISIGKNRPNIIVVQLEGFMDPTRLKGVKFNKDPMPNVRNLMKNYTSGLMRVPVTGGGTARTEYEVLSGSSFEFLNGGEIPYETFLSNKPSESLATTLNSQGYESIVIHNFYQTFYNRKTGLGSLGFNEFIPLDIMTNIEYTPMYWPKDKILNRYIKNIIDDEKTKDKPKFIFAISTQGHSRYPMNKLDINYPIEVVKSDLNQADNNQISYYASQVFEMDQFVGDLVKIINNSKEPTILALYGDHLPALRVIKDDKAGVDKFESLFVVANNIKNTKKQSLPKDFSSSDLSTLILKEANLRYGPMNLVHAYYRNSDKYKDKLKLVQYDILFGKKYFLSDREIQPKNMMKIKSREFQFKNIEKKNGKIYAKGEGFNRNTKIFIDNKEVETKYIDYNTLEISSFKEEGIMNVSLKILDRNGNEIQQSKSIKFKF